jgi:hypothetical protein
MQQSKAYVIKNDARNRKAAITARKAEYLAYRYGTETPYAREIPQPHVTAKLTRPAHTHAS